MTKSANRPAKASRRPASAPPATISIAPAEIGAITRLAARIEELQPETAADYVDVVEIVKEAKRRGKAIEEQRFEVTRPLDASKKAMMALVRKPLERLDAIEAAGKKKVLIFVARAMAELPAKELKAQREVRRQALAELEAQIGKLEAIGDTGAAAHLRELAEAQRMPVIVLPTGIPDVPGVSLRKRWKFRLVNPEVIPDEYWRPDPALIEKVVAALGPHAGIPGIEVWQEQEVAITT